LPGVSWALVRTMLETDTVVAMLAVRAVPVVIVRRLVLLIPLLQFVPVPPTEQETVLENTSWVLILLVVSS